MPTNGNSGDDKPAPPAVASTERAGLKLVIELAPLAVWLVVFKLVGLIPATAVLIVATLISVAASRILLGSISPMLMITAVLVLFFGGLTVGLNDARFIKIKPTVVNLLFAGGLLFGQLTGRNFLKVMLGEAMPLTPAGWRMLTYRWVGLFVVQAALNEIIWRATDTPQLEHLWGYYKFPGMFVLTLLFTVINIPFIRRHAPVSVEQQ